MDLNREAYEASLEDDGHDDDVDADFYPPTRRTYACFDRMCGAQDCSNCHPGTEPQEE